MSTSFDLGQTTRMLVIAPHPDDETLATGELIQAALALGARLRVVVATDGDNNPWPQRWIEKRWHIDALARARWGARRRAEASMALNTLGVPAQDVRYLGWPDQGITALLMSDSAPVRQLAAEIRDFSPNLIIAPSRSDLHPDHNAMGVMVELALADSSLSDCRRYGYVVHGDASQESPTAMPVDSERSSIKLDALRMHASQLALSEKRMIRLGQRREQFETAGVREVHDADPLAHVWRMPLPSAALTLRQYALYLIVETQGALLRAAIPLPRRLSRTKLQSTIGEDELMNATVVAEENGLNVKLSGARPIRRVFAKIERLGLRLLIYDGHGWEAMG